MTTTSMTAISKNNTRNTNAGATYSYYCKVCGKQDTSQVRLFAHIASRHIGAWTSNLYNLITCWKR